MYRTVIDKAFDAAERGQSKITHDIIAMQGMSGTKTRHFYNQLLSMDDARYLEVGTWKGSTVCSAMCGNEATVVCIDNWCQFGGPKQEFITNFTRHKGKNNARFIESDCYKVDPATLPKFNVFLYDGGHTADDHYKSLAHFLPCLDDTFIYIVDDWNWLSVRIGTSHSITNHQLNILYERNIRTTWDNSHPDLGSKEQTEWHNGIYVAVLQKPKKIEPRAASSEIAPQSCPVSTPSTVSPKSSSMET